MPHANNWPTFTNIIFINLVLRPNFVSFLSVAKKQTIAWKLTESVPFTDLSGQSPDDFRTSAYKLSSRLVYFYFAIKSLVTDDSDIHHSTHIDAKTVVSKPRCLKLPCLLSPVIWTLIANCTSSRASRASHGNTRLSGTCQTKIYALTDLREIYTLDHVREVSQFVKKQLKVGWISGAPTDH